MKAPSKVSLTKFQALQSLDSLQIGLVENGPWYVSSYSKLFVANLFPKVVNMWILGLLQIGTIYATSFGGFLGVRAVFGLFMGG